MNKQKIKVIFMGTPEFACETLSALRDDQEIDLQAVVTQNDKPFGRKNEPTHPPIKNYALKMKIPIFQSDNIKHDIELKNKLKKLNPDFFVVMAFGQILDKKTLKIPQISAINIHASILPKYRGASPLVQSLLNGDKETGISIMKMSEKMDKGDIYKIVKLKISKNEDLTTLRKKISNLAKTNITKALKEIYKNEITATPQEENKATYCKKITKDDGKINFKECTIKDLKNKYKAYNGWPGIWFEHKKKKIKILDYSTTKNQSKNNEICVTDDLKIIIKLKNGEMELKKFQLEGKNPVSASAFLHGNSKFFVG